MNLQLDLFAPSEAQTVRSTQNFQGLRFCVLGSGSTGNATVVQAIQGGCAKQLLVDCGLGIAQLKKRLRQIGLSPGDLDAVFITHEHNDHVGGLPGLLAMQAARVITSAGTWRCMQANMRNKQAFAALQHIQPQLLRSGDSLALGCMTLKPFAVPHDAAEPMHLRIESRASAIDPVRKMGYLTDLGHASAGVFAALQGLHALVLESNHDEQMLSNGIYPPYLVRRVGGHLGHLSNSQSAALLQAVAHPGLHTVVAAHLSLQNNRPELALAALQPALAGLNTTLSWASAHEPGEWIEV